MHRLVPGRAGYVSAIRAWFVLGYRVTDVITIDVWTWPLAETPAEIARLSGFLSADEEARAARFYSAAHGDQYRVARGRLREILGGYACCPPGSLVFKLGAAGKPFLAEPAQPLAFNLSHSGDWAALAATPQAIAALGIDIESLREIERDIAGRYFSPTEVQALDAHRDEDRTAAFFRCWTRKEAFIKATGDGMGTALSSFDVTIGADEEPALKRISGVSANDLQRWQLLHVSEDNLAPGIVGAIAVERHLPTTPVRLIHHRWSSLGRWVTKGVGQP